MEAKAGGLEGVVVAETVLSDVDGERGRLVVRGYDIEALAPRATFEEIVCLLAGSRNEACTGFERAMNEAGRERVRLLAAEARQRAFASIGGWGDALDRDDPVDALRAVLAHARVESEAALEAAPALAGMAAVAIAAWARRRRGEAPLSPDPSLRLSQDLLRMAGARVGGVGAGLGASSGGARRGEPMEALARALDAYLATVADHGMNASTFTARVVASTGSDVVSAVVAALGALKGPLHGGAPGPVLDMLDAIGAPEHALPWLEGELAAGRRIMGMGHRVYRVRDPRAKVLEGVIERLEAAGVGGGRLELARAVERAAEGVLRARYPARPLHANVEFYTAVLLDVLGLPRELFTPVFAVGRIAGWCAHFEEQRANGRLIRPSSRYVGPVPS